MNRRNFQRIAGKGVSLENMAVFSFEQFAGLGLSLWNQERRISMSVTGSQQQGRISLSRRQASGGPPG